MFIKQLGSNAWDNGKRVRSGTKGQEVDQWPEDMKVREAEGDRRGSRKAVRATKGDRRGSLTGGGEGQKIGRPILRTACRVRYLFQ